MNTIHHCKHKCGRRVNVAIISKINIMIRLNKHQSLHEAILGIKEKNRKNNNHNHNCNEFIFHKITLRPFPSSIHLVYTENTFK